jgi:hypothetical protein
MEMAGLERAQVALGFDVQPDRLGDLETEPLCEPFGALLVVPVVGALEEISAGEGASEVPDVVQ